MQSSEGVYKLIKINEKRFIINGVIYKNVSALHSKSEKKPILWNEHFMKIAKVGSDRKFRTQRSSQHRQKMLFIIYK